MSENELIKKYPMQCYRTRKGKKYIIIGSKIIKDES